jgi:hypothetical protein
VTKFSSISGIAPGRSSPSKKPLLAIGGLGTSRDGNRRSDLSTTTNAWNEMALSTDSDDQPRKDRYWAQMEKLRGFAADYRAMLEKQKLIEDAKQLTIGEPC